MLPLKKNQHIKFSKYIYVLLKKVIYVGKYHATDFNDLGKLDTFPYSGFVGILVLSVQVSGFQ